MHLLAWHLRRAGFGVHIFSYQTVRWDLKQSAASLQQFIQSLNPATLHLVGYSMGGLVLRVLFDLYPNQPPGRIVTLGTPHMGAVIAERLCRLAFMRTLIGRGMGDLLAGKLAAVSA